MFAVGMTYICLGGMSQWLGCQSLADGLSLPCTDSVCIYMDNLGGH